MKIKDFKRKIELENPEIVSIVAKDLGYQVGKRVELARLLKGLTQAELARRVSTRQSSISRIESGVSLPSLSFLVKIADALETTLSAPEFSSVASFYKKDLSFNASFAHTVSDLSVRSYIPSYTLNNRQVVFS